MVKLIVGCGYLGGRVARRWLAAGQTVVAITHRAENAQRLAQEGVQPILADVTRPETLVGLPAADTVLYAVGYDRRSGTSRRVVYVNGFRAVLDALPADTGRIILISSTGVYGQTDGSWVDEGSPCRPMREGGRVMAAAEKLLEGHRLASRGIILRLAGLYGPGRIPRIADLRAGRPIAAGASEHVNLIHVDDAATVVLAAEARPEPPRTFTVSDGHPTRRRDFYVRLAELLEVPLPQFVEPACPGGTLSRGGGNKRVCNARMLRELGVALKFPTYREGLAAIVADLR